MKVIGVDLGTTNSCVYYLDDEQNPVLIHDHLGRKTYPSVVWRSGKEKDVVVGHSAKARLGEFPSPVVAVKRKMGTTETVDLGGEMVTPVIVSAHILRFLKRKVEEITGDKVGGAVVTMPAYFDSAPKQDTYEAAVQAFFDGDAQAAEGRLELQLEPEAAAYAYTMEDTTQALTVLVYDLGGGTFDVTILEKSSDAGLTVLKFGGDPHLGGDNVDDRLALWMLYRLRGGSASVLERILKSGHYPEEKKYTVLQQVLSNDRDFLGEELRREDRDLRIRAGGGYLLDLDARNSEDMVRIQKLKNLAEIAKMDLTERSEVVISRQSAFVDQNGEPVDVDLTISRLDFNLLIDDLIQKTIGETQRVLNESNIPLSKIDRILLVGGSTRMPIVQEELSRHFDRPILQVDADLIVARGAALRARGLRRNPNRGPLTLDYPSRTGDKRITIHGQWADPLTDGYAYISRLGEDIASAPIQGVTFNLTDIPLVLEQENRFHLEVVNCHDDILAQEDFQVIHTSDILAAQDPGQESVSSKITKPIRSLGVRGFTTLFGEGELIPAEGQCTCKRASMEDEIVIPFFEGERFLDELRIAGVGPEVQIGALIDLHLVLNRDYTISAKAVVRTTRQSATVDFRISHIEIPPLEEMDTDLENVLEEIENDLGNVTDPNMRGGFAKRQRRLVADYRKARKEMIPDLHHLFTLIGELRKLSIEVRGAQVFLEPSYDEFERLLRACRKQIDNLPKESPVSSKDLREKVSVLERLGKQAWEAEDAVHWKSINKNLQDTYTDLDRAISGPPPSLDEIPPIILRSQLLAWIEEIKSKVEKFGLLSELSSEVDLLEMKIREVDMMEEENARKAFKQLIPSMVIPLEKKVDAAIKSKSGCAFGIGGKNRRTGVDFSMSAMGTGMGSGKDL